MCKKKGLIHTGIGTGINNAILILQAQLGRIKLCSLFGCVVIINDSKTCRFDQSNCQLDHGLVGFWVGWGLNQAGWRLDREISESVQPGSAPFLFSLPKRLGPWHWTTYWPRLSCFDTIFILQSIQCGMHWLPKLQKLFGTSSDWTVVPKVKDWMPDHQATHSFVIKCYKIVYIVMWFLKYFHCNKYENNVIIF